jgi:hypothetical protein
MMLCSAVHFLIDWQSIPISIKITLFFYILWLLLLQLFFV